MTRSGRPRKHKWISFKDLQSDFTPDAQYLKWTSANNVALQAVAGTGCPRCQTKNVEFRHDKKYKIIRFHCLGCRYETSYRIKTPKPGSYEIVPILSDGIQIGETIVDSYHPATRRQRSDAFVLKVSRGVESGRISLGGEWYVDKLTGGMHDQKRYYANFEEVMLVCSWNRMKVEHERRLRELEDDRVL
ncbi:MAG: hypothetical protein JSW72_08390 [Candidatus Bathyarchaeota archaeon]|nr:MAG: hypothetical protein JSW72_08390 [Candidatus Bathyarchaeota archaeon]